MCFIAITLNRECKENMVPAIIDARLDMNDDGIGLIAINEEGKETLYQRDITLKESVVRKASKNFFSAIHLRAKTTGKVDKSNVHFWKREGWTFAHNGTISKLGTEEFSDSQIFFKLICEKKAVTPTSIDINLIEKIAKENGLWGRFILTNARLKVAYLFGTWEAYHEDGVSYILSASTNFVNNAIYNGINFSKPSDISHGELKGINKIDLNTLILTNIHKTFDTYSLTTTVTSYNPPYRQAGFTGDTGYPSYTKKRNNFQGNHKLTKQEQEEYEAYRTGWGDY